MHPIAATFVLMLGAWTAQFNEDAQTLELSNANANVRIVGTLAFEVEGQPWRIGVPHDAVATRLALLDPKGNAQGYLVFNEQGDRLEALVYHRTRQFYHGTLSFKGNITFRDESFPCRTRPNTNERVLSFASGDADSTLNDSLFAPEEDEAWRAHLRDLVREDMAGDAERWKRMARRSFAGYTRADVDTAAKNRMKLLGVMYGKTLGDLFHLGSDVSARARLLDDTWDSTERNFLFALLMACPGYASYCFQPNRILDAHRAETDRFCRKVDEGTYDMSYAQERHAGLWASDVDTSPLARNFLGQKEMPSRDDSCATLFERRFKSRSFIAVLACRSYRAKHGTLPASLDELVPEFLDEVPRDPYDGEKLRWNAEKGYFWTKGRDGDFDGTVEFYPDGKPRWKNRNYHWVQLLSL